MNDSEKKNQVASMQIDEPTGLMGTQFALNIAQGVLDAVEEARVTKSQMLDWDQKELRLLSKRATKKFLGLVNAPKSDPWFLEKKKIERFYKSVFNLTIDWSTTTLPEYDKKRPRLEYVHKKFNCRRYITAYKKNFGENSVSSDNSYSQDPDRAIYEQQDRPEGNYCFAWKGSIEPDVEHLNKSYEDFFSDGNKYMIPKEGIIVAFRERFETRGMLDIEGFTCFHALVFDNCALNMCRNGGGQFRVNSVVRGRCYSDSGPRQINL